MDKNEKRRFIQEFTAVVAEEIISKIPQMPEAWDGLELRELIAAKCADSVLLSRKDRRKDFTKRLREFRNEVIIRNL